MKIAGLQVYELIDLRLCGNILLFVCGGLGVPLIYLNIPKFLIASLYQLDIKMYLVLRNLMYLFIDSLVYPKK